jgi:hypothetical protein
MKTISSEQKAAKAARRERFHALVKQIAATTDEERAQIVEKTGAVVTCEGRALSPVNTCLLLTQMPNASVVGGFRQWLKAGRCVKKGQHGAMIWVPIARMQNAECKMQNEEEEPDAAAGESESAHSADATSRSRSHFIIGTVFDISQTAEKPMEQPIPDNPDIATDMRFDPTNPQKVPLAIPVKRRRGQVIPPAPALVPKPGKIDLNSVVFEPAPSSERRLQAEPAAAGTPNNIIPLPARSGAERGRAHRELCPDLGCSGH